MLSLIKGYIHFIVNWFMGFCRLVENREVGWQTQVRKVSIPPAYRHPHLHSVNFQQS